MIKQVKSSSIRGLATLVLVVCLLPYLDSTGSEALSGIIKRAVLTFAAARSLDSVISAVQGTELAANPMGMGVTFSPGEALGPLNDIEDSKEPGTLSALCE